MFIPSIALALLALPLTLAAPSFPPTTYSHSLSLADIEPRAPAAAAAAAATAVAPTTLSSIQKADFKSLASRIPQNCTVNTLSVPLTGSSLAVPGGETTSMITVGRGVQNYTCTNGNYVSAGALANLFDVSCLFSMTAKTIDPVTLNDLLPKLAFKALSFPSLGDDGLQIAINHLFVATPNAATPGISPEFALSSGSDKIIVSKLSNSTAPSNPTTNVPWLHLGAIQGQGTLAKSVFRVNTVNGQPPSSCSSEGESLSVNYASMYWFTK
ncbi:hypothetical protein IAT40_001476 [Kwoniella sp. CBS 6097]